MKKILLLLLCATAAFAQQKKYQGLLWEVSGNGLTKKSYLYGSMHVSDKVSYHLSDAFFNHLLNADIVANESDPATWGELISMLSGMDSYDQEKFYTEFYMSPYNKENLQGLFNNRNFTLNNILSRTNEYNKDYQEETYLDMFIYRTGRKYNKHTVGLEDTKTSLINAATADYSRAKPNEENRAALQKILKNISYKEAMTNFYREKDLDMLDSLTVLSSSEEYLKALLYDRNIVMVKSIDSLARTGSLFAAVGAAHLPGKKGIIELLRQKGYTVTPVYDNYTEKGKSRKEQIEKYYIKPEYKTYTSADGMISLPLYKMTIENKGNVQAPDLANGGYINVKRMLLRDYLSKDGRPFDHKSLDSLFYENIPGKILEKKFYTQDGYNVYDIKNITKTGGAQHYRYYISPLEIISISMAGEGGYTRQFEGDIFNSITLKPLSASWKKVKPKKGGFTAEMPSYTAIYGDTDKGTANDVTIYAYDTAEKAYYFVQEKTVKDNETLEDTEFELKRIQYEFYRQLGIDSLQTKVDRSPLGVTSSATLGNKAISLKGVVNGAKYYLMGSINASEAKTGTFFRSFTTEPSARQEEYTVFADSTAGFSISVPKNANEGMDFNRLAMTMMQKAFQEKDISYTDDYRHFNFNLPSGQVVNIMYHKYGKYTTMVPDTLWSNVRKYYTNQYVPDEDYASAETEYYVETAAAPRNVNSGRQSAWRELLFSGSDKLSIIDEKITNNGTTHTYEGTVVRENSEQAIKLKVLHRNNITYSLNLLTPKNYKGDDAVVEKLFSSFTLLEDKTGPQPADKFKLFMEDAVSGKDSIREAAMASLHQVKISANDMPALKAFLQNFTFEPEETSAQGILYTKIGAVKDPAVIPFLEEQYKREGIEAALQLSILEAIAMQKSETAYNKILELLEYDLPVPEDDSNVADLFNTFEQDTKNSAVLFPGIMQFYSIPEYHDPLIQFTAALLNENAIKAKKIAAYKKMVLTNARLELKREKSRVGSRRNRYSQSQGNLHNYIGLLYPFRNDKDVKPVFNAVKALDNTEIKLQLARLSVLSNDAEEQELKMLLEDGQTLFSMQSILRNTKYASLLKNISDESMARSAILSFSNKKSDDITVTLVERKTVKVREHTVTFFFYRIKSKQDKEYYRRPDALAAVAFVNTPDGKINPEAYQYISPELIQEESEVQQYMRDMIDAEVNVDKARATFGKIEESVVDIHFEDYMED